MKRVRGPLAGTGHGTGGIVPKGLRRVLAEQAHRKGIKKAARVKARLNKPPVPMTEKSLAVRMLKLHSFYCRMALIRTIVQVPPRAA